MLAHLCLAFTVRLNFGRAFRPFGELLFCQ